MSASNYSRCTHCGSNLTPEDFRLPACRYCGTAFLHHQQAAAKALEVNAVMGMMLNRMGPMPPPQPGVHVVVPGMVPPAGLGGGVAPPVPPFLGSPGGAPPSPPTPYVSALPASPPLIGGPVAIPGAPSSASYVWVLVLVVVGVMLLGGAGFALMLLR